MKFSLVLVLVYFATRLIAFSGSVRVGAHVFLLNCWKQPTKGSFPVFEEYMELNTSLVYEASQGLNIRINERENSRNTERQDFLLYHTFLACFKDY
jgi:hypothetical protein